mgnify:CR=1 FL=1|jgi:hypothetical protein
MWGIFNYNHWRYKNTVLLIFSIIVFLFLADTPFVHNLIDYLGEWGYFGAVLTGIFAVLTFTAAPALVILYNLSDKINIYELALLAGLGSVIGDFLIFSFFKDKVFIELEPIITRFTERPFMHIFHTPYFAWLTPVIGAIIIASPLPDEMGVALLSASKIKKWQFILLTFMLNSLGLLIIISGARAIFN